MSGGDQIEVDPETLHRVASSFRARAADFTRDKPPDPGDDTWPSQRATRDYNNAVGDKNQAASDQHHDKADGVDLYTGKTVATDQENGARLGGLSGGGKIAQGVDAQGIGALLSPFTQLGGQAMTALTQLFGSGVQWSGTVLGQITSGAGSMFGSLGSASMKPATASAVHLEDKPDAGASGGGGAVGAPGGVTRPASGRGEPAPLAPPAGSSTGGGSGDYVHLDHNDSNQVHPAGMGMGGGMGGIARGLTDGGGASNGPVKTWQIAAPGQRPSPDEPEPEKEKEPEDAVPLPLVAAARKVADA